MNISQLKIYLSSKSSLKAFIYLIILTKHSTLKKQVHKNVEMKLWNKITGIYTHTHSMHTQNYKAGLVVFKFGRLLDNGTCKQCPTPEFLNHDNHKLIF